MTEKPVGTRLADLEDRVAELEQSLSDLAPLDQAPEKPAPCPCGGSWRLVGIGQATGLWWQHRCPES